MRNRKLEETRETKKVQPRPVENRPAAALEYNKEKNLDDVRRSDRPSPSIHDAVQSKESNALVPLLWILIPLIAVVVWQIFLASD